MNELTLQILSGIKLLMAVTCGMLYGIGGMKHKFIRRFIMPIVLAITIVLISTYKGSFNWWFLVAPIIVSVATHIGYGADKFLTKLLKRAIVGLTFASAGTFMVLGGAGIPSLILHALIAISSFILLGVWNPFNARDEETILGTLNTVVLIFMA